MLERLNHVVRSQKTFAYASAVILFVSVLGWAIPSAQLQLGNADQLVDGYLFADWAVWRGATFPGTHSFLLKWPLLWLVGLYNSTNIIVVVVTTIMVFATVSVLAYLLYRIEKRPLVLGCLYLALASVLMLVPVLGAPGVWVPVNMAMLTTRNIEYVSFIAGMWLVIKSPGWRSWLFAGAVALLGVTMASDKLFIPLSVGGSVILLGMAYAYQQRTIVKIALRWLVASVMASIAASIMLILLGRVVHIASAGSSSPYGLTHSPRLFLRGLYYGLNAVVTNFGANPLLDTNLQSRLWVQFVRSLTFGGILGYIVNMIILAAVVFAGYFVTKKVFCKPAKKPAAMLSKSVMPGISQAESLSICLIASSLAALLVFAVTSQFYPTGARYMGIVLFAGFIALATYMRQREFNNKQLYICGAVLALSLGIGALQMGMNVRRDQALESGISSRNAKIVAALRAHPVETLVGDYWRVLPIRQQSGNTVTVSPMASCVASLKVLSSTAWQPDLRKHSFAYLVSTVSGSQRCNTVQIMSLYGPPSSSVVILGTVAHPLETLLFYDQGRQTAPQDMARPGGRSTTNLPIRLQDVRDTNCPGSTTMQIVAHQDDDLLFMNPDVQQAIAAGDCARTVYLTAGDAGGGELYWLAREQGSQAAYAAMVGVQNDWLQQIVSLGNNNYVAIATLRNNPKISLIFMHLPDGNVQGQGFVAARNQSLQALLDGQLQAITSVDNDSIYNKAGLTSALASLLAAYAPHIVRTQASVQHGAAVAEHSDHLAAGMLAQAAVSEYITAASPVTLPNILSYAGYQAMQMPPNIPGDELIKKREVFLVYARKDPHVCPSQCQQNIPELYEAYLQRQYLESVLP